MVIKDPHVLDIILATVVGNLLILRDPLWLMVIAPSSGGKSTFLAPVTAVENCHFIDDLTEKTFLSGYKVAKKEVSLLKIIGNGIMCFSDFTSILAKNPNSRGEILGQLRLVYDGVFSKRTGVGEIVWRGKMGFLGACTTDIYKILEESRAMGERFLYFTLMQPTDKEIVAKQREVNMSAKQISEAMQPMYKEYIDSLKAYVVKHETPELVLNEEQEEAVNQAAIFCVSAKATVHLDFKTSKPDSLVSKPGVGRDRKMFQTLLHALLLMRAHETGIKDTKVDDDMIRIVQRAAYSSVSRERRRILEILTSFDTMLTASEIGSVDDFGLPRESVERYLYVLHAVGLVQRTKKGSAVAWVIKDEEEKKFIRDLSGVTKRSIAEIKSSNDADEEETQVELSAEDEAARQADIKGF